MRGQDGHEVVVAAVPHTVEREEVLEVAGATHAGLGVALTRLQLVHLVGELAVQGGGISAADAEQARGPCRPWPPHLG